MAAALSRLGHPLHDGGRVRLDPRDPGLAHVIAGTDLGSSRRRWSGAITAVPRGLRPIAILSSDGASRPGFLGLNLGLWALFRVGYSQRLVALAVAAISVVCLVSLIIGHNAVRTGVSSPLSRACYFPWVAWTAALGVGFLQGRDLE